MPEIFRFFGYSFFFYSREHEPVHVHVEGNGGLAIFDLKDGEFVIRTIQNIKSGDKKRIIAVVNENADIIIKHWNKHFN